MVDDARARLTERGIRSDSRVFIFGFSASGSFANRFTLLHPDRVKAVSAGSPGAYPVAPLAEWKGKRLPFPVGVADLEEIVGRKFDSETFRYSSDKNVAALILSTAADGNSLDGFTALPGYVR